MKKDLKINKNTSSKAVSKTAKTASTKNNSNISADNTNSITLKLPKFSFGSIKNFKFNGHFKTLVLTLVAGLLLGYVVTSLNYVPSFKNVSTMEAKKRAEGYLATLPLQSYEIKEIKDTGSVYTVELLVNGQSYTSYMTKDGNLLFQGGVDLTKPFEESTAANQQTPQELPKTDKPNVELFVMSHCPYGTQMEKGILPVVDALGDKIDFEIKFVDYAMHGEKEVVEQLNQYCIQKISKPTYISYLKCFLDKGDSASCLTANNINQAQLKACTTEADAKYGIMAGFKDQTQWKGSYPPFNTSKEDNVKYSVQGSPTLVINGVEAQTARDSASLLDTICSSFNNAPEACNVELESAQPTPGFGYNTTTTDASTAAQCL